MVRSQWAQEPGAPVDRPRLALDDAGEGGTQHGGAALATVGEDETALAAGDALVVPAGRRFSLANPSAEPFRAVVALPVGGRAFMPGQAPFVPPWAE